MVKRLARVVFVVTACCFLIGPASAPAQRRGDDATLEASPERQLQAEDLLEDEVLAHPGEDWIGGGLGTVASTRERFEAQLKSRIDRLNRRYGLTDAQKKKLFVAGQGDIKRFFARLDDLRTRRQKAGGDRDALLPIVHEFLSVTQAAKRDLFDDRSIFAKTTRATLTREQVTRYEGRLPEIALRRHRETIRWVVSTWDETIKLTADQHARLESLLLRETRPPRTFGYNDYFGLLLQAARHEPAVKSILTGDQWTSISLQIAEAKKRETDLKAEGYVPDDGNVARTPGQDPQPAAQPRSERG